MKSQSGITLLTLIVYVVGLAIVIGIITLITNFYNNNVMTMEEASGSAAEYSKFNLAFIQEVKTEGNSVKDIDTDYVLFSTGNKYTYVDNKIYKNKITIANDISDCSFKLKIYEGKQIVSVYIQAGGENGFAQTIDYVVSNSEESV